MTEQEVLRLIKDLLADIAESKGLKKPEIGADTQLLGGEVGIDSLDLASLVHQLEEATGRDPFRSGFVNFQTAGELARLYQ
jgi:acyl carrier protein